WTRADVQRWREANPEDLTGLLQRRARGPLAASSGLPRAAGPVGDGATPPAQSPSSRSGYVTRPDPRNRPCIVALAVSLAMLSATASRTSSNGRTDAGWRSYTRTAWKPNWVSTGPATSPTSAATTASSSGATIMPRWQQRGAVRHGQRAEVLAGADSVDEVLRGGLLGDEDVAGAEHLGLRVPAQVREVPDPHLLVGGLRLGADLVEELAQQVGLADQRQEAVLAGEARLGQRRLVVLRRDRGAQALERRLHGVLVGRQPATPGLAQQHELLAALVEVAGQQAAQAN